MHPTLAQPAAGHARHGRGGQRARCGDWTAADRTLTLARPAAGHAQHGRGGRGARFHALHLQGLLRRVRPARRVHRVRRLRQGRAGRAVQAGLHQPLLQRERPDLHRAHDAAAQGAPAPRPAPASRCRCGGARCYAGLFAVTQSGQRRACSAVRMQARAAGPGRQARPAGGFASPCPA